MGVKISEKVVHLVRESGFRHDYPTLQLLKLNRSFVEYPCPVGDDYIFKSRRACGGGGLTSH